MPMTNEVTTGKKQASASRKVGFVAFLLPLLSLLVVRPWVPSAFPVWDYAEMLPILQRSHGFWDAFSQLSQFTRLDGRANYLTYFQIAGTWQLVGNDPVGWQWSRALLMVLVGVLFTTAVRKMGGSLFVAGMAGLFTTLTVPATEGWLFLMGEPLAAVGLLLIVLVLPQSSWPTEWSTGIVVAGLAISVVLAKEVVGLALPLALLLCWLRPPEREIPPRSFHIPPRQLLLPLLAAAVFSILNAGAALRDAAPAAYAAGYQPTLGSLTRVPHLLESIILPVTLSASSPAPHLYPANLAFILLLAAAGLIAATHRHQSRMWFGFCGILVLLPVVGAIAYSFWPRYSAFYGIPFSLGGAGILTLALSTVERSSPRGKLIASLWVLIVVGFTALSSGRSISHNRAVADLAAGVTRIVGQIGTIDTLFVIKAGPNANKWPVTGPELERYAQAIGDPRWVIPTMRDVSCEIAVHHLKESTPRVALLNDQNRCGSLPAPSTTLIATVHSYDWMSWRTTTDTLSLQLQLPPSTNHSSTPIAPIPDARNPD